jgi:hypothetical protein
VKNAPDCESDERRAFGVAGLAFFAVGDVISKHLTMLYAVPLVMALRYAVNLGLLTAVLGPKGGMIRTQ